MTHLQLLELSEGGLILEDELLPLFLVLGLLPLLLGFHSFLLILFKLKSKNSQGDDDWHSNCSAGHILLYKPTG